MSPCRCTGTPSWLTQKTMLRKKRKVLDVATVQSMMSDEWRRTEETDCLTAGRKDGRMGGWVDGWRWSRLSVRRTLSVTAPSCSSFLLLPRSQVLWARLTVRDCDDHMVTCLRKEVGSRGWERWSRSVQLPPRHPMSLTWSLRLVNLQVTILSRWALNSISDSKVRWGSVTLNDPLVLIWWKYRYVLDTCE